MDLYALSEKPAVEPRLMLMESTPNLTESSRAAKISSSYAPPVESPKTFIIKSCASGATPSTIPPPFAPTIPAT